MTAPAMRADDATLEAVINAGPGTYAFSGEQAVGVAEELLELRAAMRYRRTYGRESWTPEQIDRAVAAAPVVRRPRVACPALLSTVPDPVTAAARTLAIGEWTNWGERPAESWDQLDAKSQLVEISDHLMKARWLLGVGGLVDPTVRAT